MLRVVFLVVMALAAHNKAKAGKKSKLPTAPVADLSAWQQTHPDAASALSDWARDNPVAAKDFFAWDKRTGNGSKVFIDWAINQRQQSVSEFLPLHPDWKAFAELVNRDGLAYDRLMRWCREHPKAADELVPARAPFFWLSEHVLVTEKKP